MLRFAMALLLSAVCCSARAITFDTNMTVGSSGVTGNIVIDGTIGLLGANNIVGSHLALNDDTDLSVYLIGSNSGDLTPTDQVMSATAAQLLYSFSVPNIISMVGGPADVCWAANNCLVQEDSGVSLIVDGNVQFTSLSGTQVIGGATPEPSTLVLLGLLGMAALGFWKLRVPPWSPPAAQQYLAFDPKQWEKLDRR